MCVRPLVCGVSGCVNGERCVFLGESWGDAKDELVVGTEVLGEACER